MPSDDYSIQATTLSTIDHSAVAGGKTATGFLVRTFREGVGLANIGFTFTVHATNAQPPKGGTGADAWASTNADSSLTGSYNLSVANGGTGIYDYTFTEPMPNGNYAVVATGEQATLARTCAVSNRTAGGFRVTIANRNGDAANAQHSVVVHATNATLPHH